jgi:hypothetical protein
MVGIIRIVARKLRWLFSAKQHNYFFNVGWIETPHKIAEDAQTKKAGLHHALLSKYSCRVTVLTGMYW